MFSRGFSLGVSDTVLKWNRGKGLDLKQRCVTSTSSRALFTNPVWSAATLGRRIVQSFKSLDTFVSPRRLHIAASEDGRAPVRGLMRECFGEFSPLKIVEALFFLTVPDNGRRW